MNLVLDNHVIDASIIDILKELNKLSGNKYFKIIRKSGDDIAINCPFHKDGQEAHPSCFVYNRTDSDNVVYGYFKCFTCHEQGQLYKLVAHCLNCTYKDAIQWLIDNYSNTFREVELGLSDINLDKPKSEYIDESILYKYRYFHPYMFTRKLTKDIIRKFNVGWNPETDSITFPMYDEHNNLVGITERSVNSKHFHIPKDIDMPVYLLNHIKNENISEVYVTESQLDALYMWSLGYPAIALIGTGGKKAYSKLLNSGIRLYHLCFDGDLAGKHGAMRFINNMPDDVFIDVIQLPHGKDVNDLSLDELKNLPHFDKLDYLQYCNSSL